MHRHLQISAICNPVKHRLVTLSKEYWFGVIGRTTALLARLLPHDLAVVVPIYTSPTVSTATAALKFCSLVGGCLEYGGPERTSRFNP